MRVRREEAERAPGYREGSAQEGLLLLLSGARRAVTHILTEEILTNTNISKKHTTETYFLL